jgi:uncharacterized protein
MILYLDTSAVVKLHVDEEHTEAARLWVDAAERLATSIITLPEAAAAFARRRRLGHLDEEEAERLLASLTSEWTRYAHIFVDASEAAAIAWRHGLRGMDAVQLAAAGTVRAEVGDDALAFASFDDRLNHAAAAEGLLVLHPSN